MVKNPLAQRNTRDLYIQAIKSIQGTKPSGIFLYDLLKYISIKVDMIRIAYDHAVFSWNYDTYKSILGVETDDILMATHNRVCF